MRTASVGEPHGRRSFLLYTSGVISLSRSTSYSVGDALPGVAASTSIARSEGFEAAFQRVSGADLGRYLRGETIVPAVGACLINPGSTVLALTQAALDAGPSVTANGPGGEIGRAHV